MTSPFDVARLRKEYLLQGLRRSELAPDPFRQFEAWFDEAAKTSGQQEPNAMTLATSTPDGAPSARVVLLKGFGPEGFAFYTNYKSRKGQQLASNPRAALSFYWPWLERQVQIEGNVVRMSREDSEAYFRLRPLGSRYGALASRQSRPLEDRAELERNVAEAEAVHGPNPPMPSFWGGYRVLPARFEFWQGRENRLHDRFVYLPKPEGGWEIQRLSP
ncbi:MAG: pyridoxamine 5'-phosphate oxidase [Verrucomicrobia bacterium]|nr:pyridoxamine 5'-phosphate oxidase [Verrucomicrobiota bacterium]